MKTSQCIVSVQSVPFEPCCEKPGFSHIQKAGSLMNWLIFPTQLVCVAEQALSSPKWLNEKKTISNAY